MRIWLSVLLVVAVSLAGCTDEDDELVGEDDPGGADSGIRGGASDDVDGGGGDTGGGDPGDPGGDPGTDPEREPETHQIVIKDNRYVDGSITVQAGDTVRWLHQDQSTEHTVTADDGSFDSGSDSEDFMNGFTYNEFEHTFDAAGDFPYHCKVHPSMTGTITVQA